MRAATPHPCNTALYIKTHRQQSSRRSNVSHFSLCCGSCGPQQLKYIQMHTNSPASAVNKTSRRACLCRCGWELWLLSSAFSRLPPRNAAVCVGIGRVRSDKRAAAAYRFSEALFSARRQSQVAARPVRGSTDSKYGQNRQHVVSGLRAARW